MRFSPGARKYLKNTSWLVGERIVRLLVGLLVVIYLARYLGPEQFGLLGYATALFSMAGMVSSLGLNRILVREFVAQPARQNVFHGTVVALRLATGIISLVIIFSLSTIFNAGNPVTPILVLIIGSGILFQAFFGIELWFQAEVKAKFAAIAKSTSFLIIAAIKATLILLGSPLIAFAFATAGEFALTALMLILLYRTLGNRLRNWKFNAPLAKNLVAESWPEVLAGFGTLVCMRMDQIMIGQMIGPEGVGIYTAASQISEALYFIPVAIVASTFPAIISARKENEGIYYKRLQQLFSGLVIYSYLVAIAISIMSGFIISILYGNQYNGAESILVIHVWTGLAVCLGVASGSWIMAEKRVKLNLYRTMLGALLNVVLNYILIQRFGITGAAIATLVSLTVAFYFFDIILLQTRRIFFMKTRALFGSGLLAR